MGYLVTKSVNYLDVHPAERQRTCSCMFSITVPVCLSAAGSYEPPLTNVFTMQWFLTMFATCLPAPTVLKIWDSVFFEGSEVLFRVGLAIWERLGE